MSTGFLQSETKVIATVSVENGSLQNRTPITIKNQVREYQLNSIEDLPDVVQPTTIIPDGSTLVYNFQHDNYEVKQIDITEITGDIDGGTF